MAARENNDRGPQRGMRISGRLLLLLAIPLVALLGITGYGVYDGASRSSEASRLQERTDIGMLAHTIAADLQTERSQLIQQGVVDPALRQRIEATGDELGRRAVRAGGAVAASIGEVTQRLTAVQRIADAELGGQVALRNHGRAVDRLLDFASVAIDPSGAIDDAASSTVDYLARARAASSAEHDLLLELGSSGSLDASAFQELTSLASAQERYTSLAASAASDDPALQVRIVRLGHEMRSADVIRREAFAALDSGEGQKWIEGLVERTQELGTLQADADVLAIAAVNDLARSSRILLAAAALGALLIVLTSAYLLSRAIRTIVRPLQDLAVQAEDVARTRLPDAMKAQQQLGSDELHLPAIRATGAAEVHEVAAAFNDVQDTALRLAGEQAALRVNQAEALTNLGRRNQTLLARQLDFISSLETRETDPVFLEHLFKLDHLASRMRRNAESLLILAGSETPRRRRTPAPVTEVVRAAMSEVEEFERVRIGHLRDATVAGPAVIDLVHLLAELIENALGFSPPESTVEIDGRPLGQGGYQFAVIDHGVGMSDLELLAANQRIAGIDELEGMPTRYLGQYVVAKLATKLGAMVRLQPSHGGRGVTAVVNLPHDALVGSPDRTSGARPLPGSRAARAQGPVPFAPGAGVPQAARTTDLTALESLEPVADGDIEPEPLSETEPAAPFADAPEWSTWSDPSDAGPVDGPVVEGPENEPVDVSVWNLVEEPTGEADPETPAPFDMIDQILDETLEPLEEPASLEEPVSPDEPAAPWSEEPASVAPTPPPAPQQVPEQLGWAPGVSGSDRSATPLFATTAEDRGGGLTRRVPGASLADRSDTTSEGSVPAPERSASGVQSMLASFHAGRSRGRGDADTTSVLEGEPAQDESTDWRSTP